jgi:hypothetical protein
MLGPLWAFIVTKVILFRDQSHRASIMNSLLLNHIKIMNQLSIVDSMVNWVFNYVDYPT